MKTIGLIGGITWHSTLDYYRLLNEGVNDRLGGYHSAKIILNSVDFAEIKMLTEKENWEGISEIISKAAKDVEAAGAHCLLLGANTMHNIATQVQASVNIPLIHVADVVAKAITAKKLNTVALLGTKYTMQLDFYKNRLRNNGIQTIIPGEEDIAFINRSIYTEFSKGVFSIQTKQAYLHIIDNLIEQGAEGVIFGCTEIPILIKQQDCSIPVFDTAYIHAMAAVDFVLGD